MSTSGIVGSFVFSSVALAARRASRTGGKHILTGKRGPKNFYKGKGAKTLGHIGNKGGFTVEKWRLPEYVKPGSATAALGPAELSAEAGRAMAALKRVEALQRKAAKMGSAEGQVRSETAA